MPALQGRGVEVVGRHPRVDDHAQAGHADELVGRHGGVRQVGADLVELGGHLGLAVGEPVGEAEDLAEVDDADGDATGLEQLLAVAHGLEGVGSRADGPEARPAHAVGDLADAHEPVEVGAERVALHGDGVALGERVGEAVLAQVAAGRDLAAEGVAAALQVEGGDVIGVGLQEDGHIEPGEAHRVGDALLVAEVGQHHEDTLDVLAVRVEELGAELRLAPRLDAAELGGRDIEDDRLQVHRLEQREHVRACLGDEGVGEEVAVADDDAQCCSCHLSSSCGALGLWVAGASVGG